jgi:hypothetical protein
VSGAAAAIADRKPPGLNGLPWPNVYTRPLATPEPGTLVGCGMFATVAQLSVAML